MKTSPCCPVCGGVMEWTECCQCGGAGGFHDCGEDCCPCADTDEFDETCVECDGTGGYLECCRLPHSDAQMEAYYSRTKPPI